MRAGFSSLPMYDWPEINGHWDAFWSLVRVELADAGFEPRPALARDTLPAQTWRDPDLILGQTCGWPYVSSLSDEVAVFGRFDFGLPTVRPGDYFSVLVMRPGSGARELQDLGERITGSEMAIAVNGPNSQSGFRALGACLAEPFRLPRARMVETGSHRASIRAVAEGRADLAAIDAQSWELALRHEPAAKQVEIVARTPDMPGLPLITGKDFARLAPDLMNACKRAASRLDPRDRQALGLREVVPAAGRDYEVLKGAPFNRISLA